MGLADVNGVPIVGEPVAYGVGFLVLLIIGFGGLLARYFLTLAHEGGHALAAVLTLRPVFSLTLGDDGGGLTITGRVPWSPFELLVTFAGYAAPPLFGLGGAALIADGNPYAVLVIAAFFSILAIAVSRNALAFTVPFLLLAGVAYVLLRGSLDLQAAVAVGLVWFLLVFGLVRTFELYTDRGDAASLAQRTLVPGVIWKLLWIAIAVVSLVAGARLLLVG